MSFRTFESARQDLRFGLRMLARSPVTSLVAVLTLALGVGLNTAIFTVVESVLLRQMPYGDPDRIVALSEIHSSARSVNRVDGWLLNEWARRGRTLERAAVYDDAQMTLLDHGAAEVLRGLRVNAGFFDTLGVAMRLGRGFLPEEDRARANVIVLTNDFWTARFAADPKILERVLDMSGESYRVVGVLPAGFVPLRMTNPAERPQYFGTIGFNPSCQACPSYRAVGKLKAGVTVADAAADLRSITEDAIRAFPADYPPDTAVRVEPLRDRLVGPVRRAVWIAFGAVVLVLLLASANVAGLQLATAAARRREFALRAALGSGRGRLVAQLLVENLCIAVAGGAGGVLLGVAGTSTIASFAPRELPRFDELHVDARVLVFSLLITVSTGLLFGLAPAWRASKADPNDALKRGGGAGRASGGRVRQTLVVLQVALAFALVAATGLLGRTFENLGTVDAGFDPHNVLTLSTAVTATGRYADAGRRLQYYRHLVNTVEGLPDVVDAGMVSNVPLSRTEPMALRREDEASVSDADAQAADVYWASPGYCRVVRIPLRRGRFLTDRDGVEDPPAVLISESLARHRFAGVDPIGRRIRIGPNGGPAPWQVIVGIVGDVRYDGLDRPAGQAVYQTQAVNPFHYTRLIVRTTGDPRRAERSILAAIHDLDPTLAVFHIQPLDDYITASLADRSFTLALMALFVALALVLSALGLFALVSHAVVERTPELGVRAALGASRGALLGLILRDALAVTGLGLGLGLFMALAVTRLVASSLYGVGPSDPATLAATAALLAGAAAVAAYLPARLAARVSPLAALRAE